MASVRSDIQDFGEKIPGSKKEWWRERNITAETVGAMSVMEQLGINKKDLWKEPNYTSYCDDGVPAEYMFFVYRIYHAIESKLPDMRRENVSERTKSYVEFITGLRDFLLNAVRGQEFYFWDTLYNSFLRPAGYISEKFNIRDPYRGTFLSEKAQGCPAIGKRLVRLLLRYCTAGSWVSKGHTAEEMYSLFCRGLSDTTVRADILRNTEHNYWHTYYLDCYASGFPYDTATCVFGIWYAISKKDGYVLRPENARCKNFWYKSPDGTLDALYVAATDGSCRKYVLNCMSAEKDKQKAEQEAIVREMAEKSTKEQSGDSMQKIGTPIVTRIELPNQYVLRNAPRVRKGSARPEHLTYDSNNIHAVSFGFRGGEFGNWQNKRQECLDCTVDAFSDLAYALDLPYSVMSLCFTGKLEDRVGLAWGSRGSGRASAHYDPANTVINLTKYRGAGSLAHEWGHALDHACGKLYSNICHKDVSEGYMTVLVGAGKPDGLTPEYSALYDAFKHLIDVMNTKVAAYTPVEKMDYVKEQHENARMRLQTCFSSIQYKLKHNGRTEDIKDWDVFVQTVYAGKQTPESVIAKIRSYNLSMYSPNALLGILTKYIPVFSMTEADVPATRACKTRFSSGAIVLDNMTTTKRVYYSKIYEMFARAFESYVEDKLGDIVSQYLVYGTKTSKYRTMYGVDLYPLEEERTALNAAFDELFNVIRGQIVKAAMPEKICRLYTTAQAVRNTYFETETEGNNVAENTNVATDNTVPISYKRTFDCAILQRTQIVGVPAVVLKDIQSDLTVTKTVSTVRAAVSAGLIRITQGKDLL